MPLSDTLETLRQHVVEEIDSMADESRQLPLPEVDETATESFRQRFEDFTREREQVINYYEQEYGMVYAAQPQSAIAHAINQIYQNMTIRSMPLKTADEKIKEYIDKYGSQAKLAHNKFYFSQRVMMKKPVLLDRQISVLFAEMFDDRTEIAEWFKVKRRGIVETVILWKPKVLIIRGNFYGDPREADARAPSILARFVGTYLNEFKTIATQDQGEWFYD